MGCQTTEVQGGYRGVGIQYDVQCCVPAASIIHAACAKQGAAFCSRGNAAPDANTRQAATVTLAQPCPPPHSSGLVARSLWLRRSSGLESEVASPVASLKAMRM